jgi:hypothetical protein
MTDRTWYASGDALSVHIENRSGENVQIPEATQHLQFFRREGQRWVRQRDPIAGAGEDAVACRLTRRRSAVANGDPSPTRSARRAGALHVRVAVALAAKEAEDVLVGLRHIEKRAALEDRRHPRERIGVVLGSTRTGRFADRPAEWLLGIAKRREGVTFERVDLRDYPMPFYDEAKSPMREPAKNEVAQRWARKVGELDAFIFITGEYNRSIPAVLKNALDHPASM